MLPTMGPWKNIFGTKRGNTLLWKTRHSELMFINPLLRAVFARGSAYIGGFGEALNVDLFIPGIASLVNHHSALDNGTPPIG
jgi:hypothetical protein